MEKLHLLIFRNGKNCIRSVVTDESDPQAFAASLCRRRGFRRWQLVCAEGINLSDENRRLLGIIKKRAGSYEEVDWDVFTDLLARAGRVGFLMLPDEAEPKRRRRRR